MAGFEKGKKRPASAGRKKGTPNRNTAKVKDMILGALNDVGGQGYLARQAEENPKAFLSLLGRVLPIQTVETDKADTAKPGILKALSTIMGKD